MQSRRLLRYLFFIVIAASTLAAVGYRFHIYRANLKLARSSIGHEFTLSPRDRILVIAPHCDDESLGCGGVLARASRMRLPVRVVIVTNGDGFKYAAALDVRNVRVCPDDYISFAEKRQQESLAALAGLGVAARDVIFLGYPDRGTDEMWLFQWLRTETPYFSPFTCSFQSPYPNSFTRNVTHCGENELRDFQRILRDFRPTLVFAPHPNDAHPDHWASHAFVMAAIYTLGLHPHPRVLTYVVHRGPYPAPKGLKTGQPIGPPYDLVNSETVWLSFQLTPEEERLKQKAVLEYKSQLPLLKEYLLSFVRRNELFGLCPETMPTVPARHIRVDGCVDDWQGTSLTFPDPTADTVSLRALGAADFSAISLARNQLYFYVLARLRDSVAYPVVYRFYLHAFTRLSEEDVPFKVEIVFRHPKTAQLRLYSPARATFPGNVIQCRSRGKCIEIAVPFYLLGNQNTLMLAAMSSIEKVHVDKTAFFAVSTSEAFTQKAGPASKARDG